MKNGAGGGWCNSGNVSQTSTSWFPQVRRYLHVVNRALKPCSKAMNGLNAYNIRVFSFFGCVFFFPFHMNSGIVISVPEHRQVYMVDNEHHCE